MSDNTLREQLIGTWELVAYTARDVATDEESYPFGERPLGLILDTHGAYMSAQLQRPGRAPFAQRRPAPRDPEEYAAADSSYIAYSGRFFVNEEKQCLSHEMAVSFFSNWFGQQQVRVVKIDGDVLQLSTDGPQRFNGASQQSASDHEQVRQRASHLQPVEVLRRTRYRTFVNPNSPLI